MEIIISVIVYVSSFIPGGMDGNGKTVTVIHETTVENGNSMYMEKEIVVLDDQIFSGDEQIPHN